MVQQSRANQLEQKRNYWKQHIDSWRETGLTQAEYCRQHNLKYYQLVYWKKRLAMCQPDLRSEGLDRFLARWGAIFSIFGGLFSIFNYYKELIPPTTVFLSLLLFLACYLTYYVFRSFTGLARGALTFFGVILCIAVSASLFLPWSSIERIARFTSFDRLFHYAINQRIQDEIAPLQFSGFLRGKHHDDYCRKEGYPDIYQAAKFEVWRSDPPPWPAETYINFTLKTISTESWDIVSLVVYPIDERDNLAFPGTIYFKEDGSIEKRNIELNSNNLGCRVVVCGHHKKELQSISDLYVNINLSGIKVNIKK